MRINYAIALLITAFTVGYSISAAAEAPTTILEPWPEAVAASATLDSGKLSEANSLLQAAAAEYHNLDEISGMGYRKALEFLVKDYLVSKSEELKIEPKEIKEKFLGKCIEDHIVDPKTKAVAKRAAWLGNDHSHYFRRWEEKDIEDLKTLLGLVINSIDNEITADKFIRDMDPKKSS